MENLNSSAKDKKVFAAKALLFFFAYAIAFSAPNYAQYQLSPIGTQIIAKYGLSTVQYNSVFTAPMIPAIFTSIISGMLVDKYGYKIVLGFTVLMTTIGCWLRVVAGDSYILFFIGNMLVGFSGGVLVGNSSKALTVLFGPEKVGVLAGLVMTISTCTLVVSVSTTAYFPSFVVAFIVSGIFATLGLALWFGALPNVRPWEIPNVDEGDAPSLIESLKVAAKSREVWLLAVMSFVVLGSMTSTSSMVPAALAEVRGFTAEKAGTVSSLMMVGNLLGSLITPTLCNKTGKFRLILALCGLICGLTVLFAWQLPSGILLWIGFILHGFALGSGMATAMGIAVRVNGIGPKYAGTAGGLIATLQLIGGVVLPTYIASPIAGTNYSIFFTIVAAFSIIWIACVLLLPKYLDR